MRSFSWIKDVIIQIVFISAAIVFTVTIAHMSIRELYTDYYIAHSEISAETRARNAELLQDALGEFAFEAFATNETSDSRQSRFEAFSDELTAGVYTSLFRGILIMAAGYILFAIIINLREKNNRSDSDENEEPPEGEAVSSNPPRLFIQLFSMIMCGALAGAFLWFQSNFDGVLQIVLILLGGLFAGIALAHLVRMILWVLGRSTETSYSAQTTQFCIFLTVFLSLFSLSMHNGFSAFVEESILEDLQINSLLASLAISHGHEDIAFDLGENSELFIYNQIDEDAAASDLLTAAWVESISLAGVRGEYKYGATAIIDTEAQVVTGVSVVRKPAAILAGELRAATLDFMLAVSATVFAFVFMFAELNRLLESLNIPNSKRERDWRFAAGAKSLNFLIIICKGIPAYFFVLIIFGIYEYNPVNWLPGEIALILPVAIVLLMMVAGGEAAARVIKLKPRALSVLGCIIGAVGFFAMGVANNLIVWLLVLAVAYLGVAIVYMGVQQFISNAANTGYREFRTLGEEALSGEYLGCASGAVLGAVVFDRFGLFAAFALSAAVMLLLAGLVRYMLPAGERAKPVKSEYGFFRFFFSKRILMFVLLLMAPFMVGEFFISQFAPLYADTINLSPGAASWTYLLMTMAAAFAAPFVARTLFGRISKMTVCVLANLLSASGLVLFSVMPGIVTMYIASALLGFAVGTGTNVIESGFSGLEESQKYAKSPFAFRMFGVLFGQLGVALFTLAHTLSPGGEYVLIVAGVIAAPTLLFFLLFRKTREVSS
ncbi:MAG: MFS transporter [Defluviitaleaceae bacterium]|nr:MFS transporter [Defluviitaleaceae bacterium]